MKWNLVRHELRQNRRSFMIGISVILLFIAMLLGKADAFVNNEAMVEVMNSLPPALLSAFGINMDSFSSFEGFFASQGFIYYVLILGAYSAVWSITGIAKEQDRGTGEFLFALPYSRSEIFWTKAVSHWMQITTVYLACAAITLTLGLATTGMERPAAVFYVITAGYFICLSFAGIGYALTPWFNSERTAMSVGLGIVFGSFLIKMIAGVDASLQMLSYLSLFDIFNVSETAKGHGLTTVGTLITFGIYAAGLILGAQTLKRRDLT